VNMAEVDAIDPEKLPWLKFWVEAWRSDLGLRKCSAAARGVWIEMLCVMHHCEPYGVLADENGKPMLNADLAVLIGISVDVVSACVEELERRKVFSRDTGGRIFSRRMLRDYHLREVRAAAGSKGGRRTAKKRSKG
jgi:hypothetical protein